MSKALFLLMLGGFAATLGCAVADRSPSAKALLVLDSALAGDRDLERELQRYRALVRRHRDYDVVIVPERKDLPPAELRALLKSRREKDSIRGAFLVGNFRMAKFKSACGDQGMFPEYYQDFIGDIQDQNGDGVLDTYDPWTGRDGAPAMQIWLALLRPYDTNVAGEPGVVDLVRYFAKVNADMEAENPSPAPGDATVFATMDWSNPTDLVTALTPGFRNVTLVNGHTPDRRGSVPATTEDFERAAAIPSELFFVFAHSGASQHFMDGPSFPKNMIQAGETDGPGRRLLEEFDVNAKVVGLLFACHGLDVAEPHYRNGRFMANSYVLNPKNVTETVIGCAKSIGLTDLDCLVKSLTGESFCDGWLRYQNRAYEADLLSKWKQVWDNERPHFNWSYVLYGNPFVRIRALENPPAAPSP